MKSRELLGPESTCPMRFFQSTSKTRLAVSDPRECEEAIVTVTRQKGTVLQVMDRLSLGVQHPLYSVDDVSAMGQEELEKFDIRLKWHLARTRSGWPLFRRKKWMKSQALCYHEGDPVHIDGRSTPPLSRKRGALLVFGVATCRTSG